jgi:hypothetical protein
VNLSKPSLVNLLMEEGEEDIAVRIVTSELPDDLDVDRDAEALAEFGLEKDDLLALLPSVTAGKGRSAESVDGGASLDRTISQRWATLVAAWIDRH